MEITKELLISLFEYKDGMLIRKTNRGRGSAGDVVGYKNTQNSYLYVGVGGAPKLVHRLVFLMHHGYLPEFIDHIDGNRENNKIENLRPATRTQNNQNSKIKKNNKLGVKGVYLHKETDKYRARICVDRKHISLGLFDNPQAAHAAYEKAAIKFHGQFANTGVTL